MDPLWTDIVSATFAGLALVLAALAWFTSMNALRTTYRPVVRTVPVAVDDARDGLIHPFRLILKNVGFGPALSVMLYETPASDADQPIAERQLVETLKEAAAEVERVGRTVLEIQRRAMEHGCSYRLIYQDIAGGWHETRFVFRENDLLMKLLGPKRWYHAFQRHRHIPRSARARAMVVRAHEGV